MKYIQKLLDIFDKHVNGYNNKDNIKKIYDIYSKKYIYECNHVPINKMTIKEIQNNKKEYYESLEKQVVEARLEVENIKNEYNEKYNKEYTKLEEEKLRLKNLIEEYTNNKNYYELIEEKNNDFEKEKEELQKEKDKIIIEKEKITFIKQKLLIMKEETILMKSELQREKEKLLEYKKNTNDIDEYFDEMINQLCEKELKNDKSKEVIDIDEMINQFDV
jgi:DNA repair exonuclease SbcCD ATPase subunit